MLSARVRGEFGLGGGCLGRPGLKAGQAVEPTSCFEAIDHCAASELFCDQPLGINLAIGAGSTDTVAGAKLVEREGALILEGIIIHCIAPYIKLRCYTATHRVVSATTF